MLTHTHAHTQAEIFFISKLKIGYCWGLVAAGNCVVIVCVCVCVFENVWNGNEDARL